MNKDQEEKYTTQLTIGENVSVSIRPIRTSDADHPESLREHFSNKSILQRFLGYVPQASPKLIKALTEIDYKCKLALVAESMTQLEKEIIAITRIACECEVKAEFAIFVADNWQGMGLASHMMDMMIEITRDLNYKILYAYTFSDNKRMIGMLIRRGFTLRHDEGRTIYAELKL